ncbi:hypothetical protein HU200_040670 [Digitaria exilis]|uniref:Uncharacterized protein n=1 Tax=Digitaria exilis TaxID=1010633 RepID=A0A835EK74_9POAL|nr:hypothetical protein HU200_040670 [Digitaria exilis]
MEASAPAAPARVRRRSACSMEQNRHCGVLRFVAWGSRPRGRCGSDSDLEDLLPLPLFGQVLPNHNAVLLASPTSHRHFSTRRAQSLSHRHIPSSHHHHSISTLQLPCGLLLGLAALCLMTFREKNAQDGAPVDLEQFLAPGHSAQTRSARTEVLQVPGTFVELQEKMPRTRVVGINANAKVPVKCPTAFQEAQCNYSIKDDPLAQVSKPVPIARETQPASLSFVHRGLHTPSPAGEPIAMAKPLQQLQVQVRAAITREVKDPADQSRVLGVHEASGRVTGGDQEAGNAAGGFSLLTLIGFLFLTFNSIMAILRSQGDAMAVAFVGFSYADLVALFVCLRMYERARAGSATREWLKVAVWILTTLLTFAFSCKVAAVMPAPVAVLVWLMAFATVAGGFLPTEDSGGRRELSSLPMDTLEYLRSSRDRFTIRAGEIVGYFVCPMAFQPGVIFPASKKSYLDNPVDICFWGYPYDTSSVNTTHPPPTSARLRAHYYHKTVTLDDLIADLNKIIDDLARTIKISESVVPRASRSLSHSRIKERSCNLPAS